MVTNIERKPTQIQEKLYIGGIFDASRRDTLVNLGIKYILIVAKNIEPQFPEVNISYLGFYLQQNRD